MASMMSGIYSFMWGILKIPLYCILSAAAVFLLLLVVYYIIARLHGMKRVKRISKSSYKKKSVFLRLLVDLPKRIVMDYMESDPNDFPYKGLVVFTGRQGNGKTIALVNEIMKMQKQYPQAKVITNLAYAAEDDQMDHWRKLTDYNNGKHGVVCGLDETQNWFSSAQSKNFPPEMLAVVTQNRKNHRIILGTAQNFYLLSKAIRTQCTEIRSCVTLFGCLTIVKRSEPELDFEGNVQNLKSKGYYFFVHDKELRESYDTYKVIENLSSHGFLEKDLKQI